ncbi:hypothetical protein DFA_05018 [Cavenderia fasciculata]|uniref:Carbohydrate binding domain-containing protein n=1 Tax=Cavenderia fasciculata TaxID=261658 RepID=F4PMZ5_CACFS|nr:uncharacterized protein DFA_05018 [Cavenderia fasciculata]EGG22888.1 hypothetical protein DFA_05018 [Cavenderia fasciculata]|eukprot:XP_004360739.1 hypothetical protein DFA_05018 [Cavenderia fasciculata]
MTYDYKTHTAIDRCANRDCLSISTVKSEFDTTLAFNGLVMSYSAYCFPEPTSTWSCPTENENDSCGNPQSSNFFTSGFNFIYQETVSDSLFYVAQRDGNYYLIFRGTSNFVNDMEDLDFTGQTAFPDPNGNAKVSNGFHRAWKGGFTVAPPRYIYELRKPVMDALSYAGVDSNSGLTIVGHSFGGAMATLASIDFALSNDYGPITTYTYGSPRVGNEDFEVLFDTTVNIETSYRVVNYEDTIPHLPLPAFTLFGSDATYSHVSTEVWLYDYSDDQYQFPVYYECPMTEQPNCSTGSSVPWAQFDNMDSVMYYHRRYFAFDLLTFCSGWNSGLEELQHPTISLNITRHWIAGGYNYTNVVGTLTNEGPVDIVNPVFKSNPNIVPVAGVWGLTPSTVNGTIHWRLTPVNGVTPIIPPGSEYVFAFTNNSTATYSFTRIQ